MRRLAIAALSIGFLVLFYFTVHAAYKLFASDLPVPGLALAAEAEAEADAHAYRLVVITQELDTPFWLQVKKGALSAAAERGVSLEMWGTYSSDRNEFLKQIEIAIASKVDGIIVQGLNTPEFTYLTKIKAAGSGIPILAVANDVPMNDSLRRTYVGSDHLEAGRMIARQLVKDMEGTGKVVLMVSDRQEDYQRSRLKGIVEVLRAYPQVKTEIVASGDEKDAAVSATDELLNTQPDAKAFIAVAANHANVIIQEIEKRSQVEPYFIYSFDDSPDSMALLKQGKIDALIAQSPEQMGELSVKLMVQWLDGKVVPLNPDGYFTNIRVLRAGEAE
ncbi:substrate-binding domain-containing protein [Paenibacillus sp. MMS18-CY102]|nr:substrate-binding domain-containing protein [Paenibacillus sp. MMS18-CY102]MWC28856.1 substrate-binding domain-containing protein [Paenibacillus sp. MMS18-CY102]